MCLGLCPTAVWFPCDLEAVSPGLSSRQGDRCPQETNVLRSTSVGTVTFCDANHIFSCIYQKLSFESDDNFGRRLMHADGCQRWETALLLSGKNMCPHYVVLARPHRTPVLHSRGTRNSIRVVTYQILFLLLKGKCIHWDLLIISTHILGASPLSPPLASQGTTCRCLPWSTVCLDCGFSHTCSVGQKFY